MNKRMRELQANIASLTDEMKGYMAEGETKDLGKAEETLERIKELKREFELEQAALELSKTAVPEDVTPQGQADGFKAMAKVINKKALNDGEKALLTGTDAANGENYLIPEDVKLEINELRKSYVSARELVSVETTTTLSGSVNYESGTPTGLIAFDDGDNIPEETSPTFRRIPFAISWHGKLIPISRILLGNERAGLMNYLNRWFVKNAVLTENAQIFAKLKAGYNSGTPKAVAGWKALKKSITVDLDPSCLIDGVIATNQSGFAALDAEEDNDGRPVLQPNPTNPTQKLFQGLPVKVYPDAQLPNIDATHFPIFYGATKAGATFVEREALEFNYSEHALFGKNQNCLRVIEGFDVMSTDTEAYIYGSFSATVKA